MTLLSVMAVMITAAGVVLTLVGKNPDSPRDHSFTAAGTLLVAIGMACAMAYFSDFL